MFNKSQIEAVSHNTGPAIVLAGPGSGKTTVITHRVKNLIEECGVLPEKILVVTFTKAAAEHMQKRFLEIMNPSLQGNYFNKSYPVVFGTFHSVYFKILRMAYNYGGDCIISEYMKSELLKEIVIRLQIDTVCMSDFVCSISAEIGRCKSGMYEVKDYNPCCCSHKDFERVLFEYKKALEAERKLDFEDILIKCYELLKSRKDVLKQWQETFKYILIDEFQDICRIQYEIIKLLAAPENNIFIVGDDDQSIYGFRGASPDIMFKFKKDYPETKEILLDKNYRSTPEIVSAGKNLISHNTIRFKKDIVSAKDGGAILDIRKFANQFEELKYVCDKIRFYINQGTALKEIAVLVRNNSQIYEVRSFLQNELFNIKCTKTDNDIYCGNVAKDIIAYVRAALSDLSAPLKENPDLIYVLNKPSRLISRQIALQDKMNIKELKCVYSHSREVSKNIEELQFHLRMIANMNPLAAVVYIKNGVGYEKYLQQYAREHKIKLSGLLKQLERIQTEAGNFTDIESWLSHIEDSRNVRNKKNNAGINILTMHAAKGLEFKAVFIIDANQGIIPGTKAVRERDYMEERRVFYVAVTRAAEFLNVYGAAQRLGCRVEMSMFVQEMLE